MRLQDCNPAMPAFKVTLAYDGTDYVGWQRQAKGVSIQGLLEDALKDLDGGDVAVAGAGRTDAGVHALGQVATFSIERDLDGATLVRALNVRLPPAVRLLAAEHAAEGFHARFSAKSKTYRYRIWNHDVLSPFERRYAWYVPMPLDVSRMARAARGLEGRHDFASFQGTGATAATTDRVVFSSSVRMDGGAVVYEIAGDGFLRHMVRAIVGSLVDIGRGHQPAEWMAEVLASRNRTRAGQTAPAAGLFLVGVEYDSLAANR